LVSSCCRAASRLRLSQLTPHLLQGFSSLVALQVRAVLAEKCIRSRTHVLLSEDSITRKIGDADLARELASQDRSLTRVYIPEAYTSDAVREIAKENTERKDVIDISDCNATTAAQRTLPDGQLGELIEILSRYRLGLRDVEPDILRHVCKYLIRRFAQGSGQSPGDFCTHMSVATLMSYILDPQEGETLYLPACGSGGLPIKAQLRLREGVDDAHDLTPNQLGHPLQLVGKERESFPYAMGRMNASIHDMDAEIVIGNTIRAPQFTNSEGGLRTFAKVTAKPMWNQNSRTEVYEKDPYARFTWGTPPASSADWGRIQHMEASLAAGGKLALVLDTGAVSRGSGNGERDVRAKFVEKGLVEAVIALPENLFYNTSAPGIILVRNQAWLHSGEILLINASRHFEKGRPKNLLTDEHVAEIADVYLQWHEAEELSAIVDEDEVAKKSDYNLSVIRYVVIDDTEPVLLLDEALVLLAQAEEARAEADTDLEAVLAQLCFEG